MFDIPKRRFVFDRVVMAGDGRFCGWLLDYYAPEAAKARPMFFSTLLEIYAHARKWEADVFWDVRGTPEPVTAFEYVMNYDPEPVYPEDMRYGDTYWSQGRGAAHKGLSEPTQSMEWDDAGGSFEAWAGEPGMVPENPYDEPLLVQELPFNGEET